VVPASLLGDKPSAIPASLTIISSMFMHGGWMHLMSNMVYLWIFGDNIEDSMGRGKFVLFYLLCGLAAALTQAMIDPTSEVPMIGASGAIAGILGAYLVLHPKANVNVLFWIIIFITTVRVPAFIVLGVWIVGQFFSVAGGGDTGVAYLAHIGGFITGMLLIPLFKKPSVRILEGANSRPFESKPFTLEQLIPDNKSKGFMEDFIDKANRDKKH
ncbi:uncharacterized protein METZ01_LOCUS127889, partial [marine metagenome]